LDAQEFDDTTNSRCDTTASEYWAEVNAADEEVARAEEPPVIPEAESYVSGRMQSWATRDVANKKAELAEEELEVERWARHTVEGERRSLARNSVSVVWLIWGVVMLVAKYYIDSRDWDIQTKFRWSFVSVGVIVYGHVTTRCFLGVLSCDDILYACESWLSGVLGEWRPSWEWCHTGG
jgi:hypothetical protein